MRRGIVEKRNTWRCKRNCMKKIKMVKTIEYGRLKKMNVQIFSLQKLLNIRTRIYRWATGHGIKNETPCPWKKRWNSMPMEQKILFRGTVRYFCTVLAITTISFSIIFYRHEYFFSFPRVDFFVFVFVFQKPDVDRSWSKSFSFNEI